MTPASCQTIRELMGAEIGVVPAAQADAAHLACCPECRAWLEDLLHVRSILLSTSEPSLPPGFEEALLARLKTSLEHPAPEVGGLAAVLGWLRDLSSPPRRGLALTGALVVVLVVALAILGFPAAMDGAPRMIVHERETTEPEPVVTEPARELPAQRLADTEAAPTTSPGPEAFQPVPFMEPILLEPPKEETPFRTAFELRPIPPAGSPQNPPLGHPGEGAPRWVSLPYANEPSSLVRITRIQGATTPPVMAIESLGSPLHGSDHPLHDAVLDSLTEGSEDHGGSPMDSMGMHGDSEHAGTSMDMHGTAGDGHMGDGPMH